VSSGLSSKPFTRAAINLAAKKGIELRTFTEVDKSVALNWVTPLFTGVRSFQIEHSGMSIKISRIKGPVDTSESYFFAKETLQLGEPHLRVADGSMKSLQEVFVTEAHHFLLTHFPEGETEWETDFAIEPDGTRPRL
jgi:hypothetical protein